jgi:hypothetical protein
VARFLVPPKAQQLLSLPLRSTHPVHTLYDVGLLITSSPSQSSSTRSFSLLDPSNSGGGHVFVHESLVGGAIRELVLCLTNWIRDHVPITSLKTALFSVCPTSCAYDHPDGKVVYEHLHFSLPMQHVRVPAPVASSTVDRSQILEGAMGHQKALHTPRVFLHMYLSALPLQWRAQDRLLDSPSTL